MRPALASPDAFATPWASAFCSCPRYFWGPASAFLSTASLSLRTLLKRGSFAFLSWAASRSASLRPAAAASLPAVSDVSAAVLGAGTALLVSTPGGVTAGSPGRGVTGLAGTAPVSGGASVADFSPADAWSDCSLVLPETEPLSCSFSPPVMNLSASSRVLGMTFSISARRAARKLSGSGLPVSAAPMASALLACAPASFSFGGPCAAACASLAFFDAGGCCLTLFALP